jgi:hypothetical protein
LDKGGAVATENVTTSIVYEDSAFDLLARFEVAGRNGLQSTTILDSALVISDCVFNTLQQDGRWCADLVGYNFRTTVADTILSSAGTYRAEVTITTSEGKLPPMVWKIDCLETRSS